jgi:hypothetical protein
MSPFEAELELPYGLVCIRFAHIIGQYFPGASAQDTPMQGVVALNVGAIESVSISS